MYFLDHATEYQEVLSPAITVCSVSSENPYFSFFHKLNSKCSLHRKSIFLYADDSFYIVYVLQLHIHILLNTIDLTNGMLYNCDMHNFYAIRDYIKFVLQSYRLWYGNRPLLLHKQPFLEKFPNTIQIVII